MFGHGGGGGGERCQNAQKHLTKKLIRNLFCKNL